MCFHCLIALNNWGEGDENQSNLDIVFLDNLVHVLRCVDRGSPRCLVLTRSHINLWSVSLVVIVSVTASGRAPMMVVNVVYLCIHF